MKEVEPDKRRSLTERHTHLWAYLSGLGLYVAPIRPLDDENMDLEGLVVSIEPLSVQLYVSEISVAPEVSSPMEGSEVSQDIEPTLRDGLNVIDFPPKV